MAALRVERDGSVLRVTLARPKRRNAFDAALIAEGMANGAVGAVSALASAFPAEVAEVVRDPTPDGAARLGELRAAVERFPRHAALKRLLGLRGIPVRADVRAPLRPLTSEEQDALDAWDAARTG